MLPYIVTILGAYLIGCSNMALYLSRWKGVNLRAGGSKNLGASNAFALMGWKAGLLVAVHDIGKAVLAVELSKWIFPAVPLLGFIAGVACVLGHMFPFYLKFKGGKGFASYLGMILAINWKVALCILAAVVILTVLTDYIVVGTVTSVVSFPIYTAIRSGWLEPTAISDANGLICRGELYRTAFAAAGIPLYDATLYGLDWLSSGGDTAQ